MKEELTAFDVLIVIDAAWYLIVVCKSSPTFFGLYVLKCWGLFDGW